MARKSRPTTRNATGGADSAASKTSARGQAKGPKASTAGPARPVVAKAGAPKTGAAKPGAAKTGAAKAGAAKPGAAKPGAAKTGAAKAGVSKASAAKPGAAKASATRTVAARAGGAKAAGSTTGRTGVEATKGQAVQNSNAGDKATTAATASDAAAKTNPALPEGKAASATGAKSAPAPVWPDFTKADGPAQAASGDIDKADPVAGGTKDAKGEQGNRDAMGEKNTSDATDKELKADGLSQWDSEGGSQDKGGADTPPPAAPSASAVPPAPAPAPAARGASPFLLVLGGLLAGGVGYFAGQIGTAPPDQTPAVIALKEDIEALRVSVADGGDIPAGLTARLDALEAGLADAPAADDLAALQDRLDDIDTRLSDISATGQNGQEVSADLAALEAELSDLRDLALNRLTEAEAAADSAEARATRAIARAGLETVTAAMDTGVPFGTALAQVEGAGVAVPDALADVATQGVASLSTLQDEFDDAARAALSASLQDAPASSTTERLGNFLRAQVGARSLSPREGDDPDAVLSRAGAAIGAGDLDTALAEIDMLPQAGQAAMGDWLTRARARQAALAALPDLTQALATD